jgi:chemotaxis protein CheD
MAETSVRLMQCAVASSGVLKIDRVGVGVGVILHSAAKKTAAGVHVLAPNSVSPTPDNPAKYANTAIPYVLDQLKVKAVTPPLSVAIVGGAAMMQDGGGMGAKVAAAVKDALRDAGLAVRLDKTGGSEVRVMTLDLGTGKVKVEKASDA